MTFNCKPVTDTREHKQNMHKLENTYIHAHTHTAKQTNNDSIFSLPQQSLLQVYLLQGSFNYLNLSYSIY